ncbi:MAG: PQQ-binding-like beta-propeller repeat protein [Verrucomicrobiota bacterium]
MRPLFALFLLLSSLASAEESVTYQSSGDWLTWRGPFQTGQASESIDLTLPEGGLTPLWTNPLDGRGTALVRGDRVYVWGYEGTGIELQEVLACLDLKTGETIWESRFNDFISDTIYNRYAIGAPVIDEETGNLYLQTTNGVFMGFSPDGEMLFDHSSMEEYGRLTFPNGRTGAPIIVGDLVIIHFINTSWGAQGPARDRFYAFDKFTGELAYVSTPGVGPQDSSFSTPFVETRYGMRVFYAGTGCGNVVAVNALNGDPLWRFQMSKGGVNSSPVVHGDKLICIHGKENVDTSEMGRMIAIQLPETVDPENPAVLDPEVEIWRNPLVMFTSSPVLVEDRVYQLTAKGELASVDVETGEIVWSLKLGNSNLHSSPLFYGGYLFAPLLDGKLFVIKPEATSGKIVAEMELEGNLIGSPSVSQQHLLLHTTEQLYCFALEGENRSFAPVPERPALSAGQPIALRVAPGEVLLQPGESSLLSVTPVDAKGLPLETELTPSFAPFIPPTAKVQAKMDASISSKPLKISAGEGAALSAGMFRGVATVAGQEVAGTVRGRVLPNYPYQEDFEGAAIGEAGFAFPPLPWIGARFKWDIREVDGNQVLAKTLDRILFQRTQTFIGHPDSRNYTFQADVMTDGNRRIKSDVGLINQRYLITLKGNWNQLEVSSNHERLKVAVPFAISPKVWYTLKTRVDLLEDGSGIIRAKAWEKGTEEPAAWTIEVPHATPNLKGAPGLFGFSPQSQKKVFVDHLQITNN